ncbi:MAG: DNA damage-inducible protein D [Rickettsiales bacterium]|nr:DNA damage-inducible protein D [Rickettsiales bacterium]
MKNQTPKKLTNSGLKIFEQSKRIDENGNEFWTARELAKILEYSEYRHFLPVIAKAQESCQNSKQKDSDHFEEFLEMVEIGSGAVRKLTNIKLSRYACYLILQNSDPAKEVVALGQSYFAVQTRLQEIQKMEEFNKISSEDEKRLFLRKELTRHNTYLASAAKEAGVVDSFDYAIFQNHGYQGLYGGLDSKGIHKKKGLKKSQKILDHMGSTELAANLFRATQTEEKIRREKISGKEKANKTHFEVGVKVRQTIKEIGGKMPENLPVADSIRKIENKSTKKIALELTKKK